MVKSLVFSTIILGIAPITNFSIAQDLSSSQKNELQSQHKADYFVYGLSNQNTPFVQHKWQAGKTLIYQCIGQTCYSPVEKMEDLKSRLS